MKVWNAANGARAVPAAQRRPLATACLSGPWAIEGAGLRWFAALAPAGRERVASMLLADAGVTALTPLKRVMVRVSRRRAGRAARLTALLPGLVFIGLRAPAGVEARMALLLEARNARRRAAGLAPCGWAALPDAGVLGWAAVMACPLVGAVIGDERPREIDPAQVARLVALSADAPQGTRAARVAHAVRRGDQVRVLDGVFEGRLATVEALRGDVAELVMALFGGEVRATAMLEALEPQPRGLTAA
jgi:transcription antitermination factor NusG